VRPLGGKGRQPVGNVGEWCVESRHLQGCSPHLCRLRTDGLSPTSKHWTSRSHAGDMGLVSLVAYRQQMFGFLHCFIGWLRRETGYGPADRPADMLRIVLEALFLGSSDSVQRCQRLTKGCYALSACWLGFPLQGVHRFKSPWLSIWVTACFWQSSRR
jgi:hypothetical protein